MSDAVSVRKRVIRARVQLLLKNPFFGYLASYLELREHESLYPTGTDGICLYYFPEKIDKLEDEEIEGVFAHEVMHLALGHLWRRGSRSKRLWNMAADYAINAILKDEFRLPEGILYEKEFENKSAEQIYNELLSEDRLPGREGETLDDHGVWGDTEEERGGDDIKRPDSGLGEALDKPAEANEANEDVELWKALDKPAEANEANEDVELWKERAIEAAAVARHQGMFPLGIARVVGELAYPSLNWRQLLHQYIKQRSSDDYDWMRPDKRLLQYGVYYPSSKSELLNIAVAVDTSGSVSDKQLDEFVAEIRNILQSFSSFQARLLACDAAVHADMVAVNDSDFESFLKCLSGSGGTDFRPVFSKIDDDPPEVLVYLTDGDGKYPDSNQPFDVIWVMNSYLEPPFGRVIRLQGYEQ